MLSLMIVAMLAGILAAVARGQIEREASPHQVQRRQRAERMLMGGAIR